MQISHSWIALLDAFSPGTAQRLGNMINEPNAKTHKNIKLNGHKKWITDRFKDIKLDHSDSRSPVFNQILEAVIISIEELDKHGDLARFEESWNIHLNALETIKPI